MNTQQVRHVRPVGQGADYASLLIDFLNNCWSHRGRVTDDDLIVIVWEVGELDQLDAFLRQLPKLVEEADTAKE